MSAPTVIGHQLVDEGGVDVEWLSASGRPLRRADDDLPKLVWRHGLEVGERHRRHTGELWCVLQLVVAVGADGDCND